MSIVYTVQFAGIVIKTPLNLDQFLISNLSFETDGDVVRDVSFSIDPGVAMPTLESQLFTDGKPTEIIIRGYDGAGPGVATPGGLASSGGQIVSEMSLTLPSGFSQAGSFTFKQLQISAGPNGTSYRVDLNDQLLAWKVIQKLSNGTEGPLVELTALALGSDAPHTLAQTAGLTSDLDTALQGSSDTLLVNPEDVRHWFAFTTGDVASGYRTHWVELDSFSYSVERGEFKPLLGELSLVRAADDASLMFGYLQDTQATSARFAINTVQKTSLGEWVLTDEYLFSNSGGLPVVADIAMEGTTSDGRLAEKLSLNLTALNHISHVVTSDRIVDQSFEGGYDAASGFEPEDLKVFGDVIFDVLTGAATGASVAPVETVYSNADAAYFLFIPTINGGSVNDNHPDEIDLDGFAFDAAQNTLTVSVSNVSEVTQIMSAFKNEADLGDITLSIDGTKLETGGQHELTITKARVASVESSMKSGSFFEDGGLLTHVIVFTWEELSTASNAIWDLRGANAAGTDLTDQFKFERLPSQSEADASIVYGGRTSFGEPDPGGAQGNQKIFLRVSAPGSGSTDWVEISTFERKLEISNLGTPIIIDVTRPLDDASAKLFALMSNNTEIEAEIEVWDDFVNSATSATEWKAVARYELGNASLQEIEQSGTDGDGDVMIEAISFEVRHLVERYLDLDENGVILRQSDIEYDAVNGTVGGAEGVFASQAPVDPETGDLPFESSPIDPLVNLSGGVRVFLEVTDSSGLPISSGDGLLDVRFSAFDDAFV